MNDNVLTKVSKSELISPIDGCWDEQLVKDLFQEDGSSVRFPWQKQMGPNISCPSDKLKLHVELINCTVLFPSKKV
jgi:hypothetical protein